MVAINKLELESLNRVLSVGHCDRWCWRSGLWVESDQGRRWMSYSGKDRCFMCQTSCDHRRLHV